MGKSDLENMINNMPAVQSYRSRTWKERHAKGTPVSILSQEDHDKWYSFDPNPWHEADHIVTRDNPEVRVYTFPMDHGLWSRVATFCNFRYKPEWLSRPDKHCAKGNCIGDGSCYHCGCAYARKH